MERENELNLQFLLLVHGRQSIILFTAWTPSVAGGALERRTTHKWSPRSVLFCSLLIAALIVWMWRTARSLRGAHGSSSAFDMVSCEREGVRVPRCSRRRWCFALKMGFLQFGSRNNAGDRLCLNTEPSKQIIWEKSWAENYLDGSSLRADYEDISRCPAQFMNLS